MASSRRGGPRRIPGAGTSKARAVRTLAPPAVPGPPNARTHLYQSGPNGIDPTRETIVDDPLPLKDIALNYHYLSCKKVAEGAAASTIADSRSPGILRARISGLESSALVLEAGEELNIELEIENQGDTLWLAGRETRMGIVMPGVRIFDEAGTLVREFHGEPPLPRSVAPGETVRLRIDQAVPHRVGRYTLKIDLVDQHICWFEAVGSKPLVLEFEVR